jgi:hypothetical protein
MLIVEEILNRNYMENNILSNILHQITTIIEKFYEINLLHIKRGLNPHDKLWAKEGYRIVTSPTTQVGPCYYIKHSY